MPNRPVDYDAPLLRLAWDFKAQALAREEQATVALTKRWVAAWRRISLDLADLINQIERDRLAGTAPTRGRLYRQEQAQALLRQIRAELAELTGDADRVIRDAQAAEATAALDDAPRLAMAAAGDETVAQRLAAQWTHVPADALTMLTGTLQPGTPLDTLLGELGQATAAGISGRLTSGLAVGRNPRGIARGIRDDWGIGLNRALRISRTEILRSYRAANLYQYQQNGHLITGWRWVASFSSRTCIACLLQHGKVFPTSVPMASHVQCRCAPVPVTASWRELGFDLDDPEPPIREGDGWRWLLKTAPQTQQRILGDRVYDLWTSGLIGPEQMWHVDHDPVWGDAIVASSVRQALTGPRIF